VSSKVPVCLALSRSEVFQIWPYVRVVFVRDVHLDSVRDYGSQVRAPQFRMFSFNSDTRLL
jgi:hypothetical protein